VNRIIHDNKGREISISLRQTVRGCGNEPSEITFVVRAEPGLSTTMKVLIPHDGTLYQRINKQVLVVKRDWASKDLVLEVTSAINATALNNGMTFVFVEATPHTAYHSMAVV